MGRAQGLVLVADVAFGAEALGHRHEFAFHVFPKLPRHEADVVYAVVGRTHDVFDKALHNRLAGHRHKRFGNGQSVGAKAASAACHGHDDVHEVPVWPNPPAPRTDAGNCSTVSMTAHSTRS